MFSSTDECVRNATSKDLNFAVTADLAFALNAAYEYMYYKANDKDEEQVILSARNNLLNRYGPKILNFLRNPLREPLPDSDQWTEQRLNQLEIAVANLIRDVDELKSNDPSLPLKLITERVEKLEAKEDDK